MDKIYFQKGNVMENNLEFIIKSAVLVHYCAPAGSCAKQYAAEHGILSPQDWINITWESGFRALAITDFQDVQAFWNGAII